MKGITLIREAFFTMNSNLVFYGTGAAEAIPSPFCSCRVCQFARERGGREERARSMFRVNEELSVDLGPDAVLRAMRFGDLTGLRHVLVTHTHLDHFCYDMMEVRSMSRDAKEPLVFWLTDEAFRAVECFRESRFVGEETGRLVAKGAVEFRRLEYGKTETVAGLRVTPLRGNHKGQVGENSTNYLLELPDGRTLYYGLDTGWYLPETFEALRGRALDLLVSECTFGLTPDRGEEPEGHLDAFSCERLIRALFDQGTLTAASHVYLTHINHYTSTGEELAAWLAGRSFPCPVTLAWDDMRIGEEA